jgi:hypothetical protein
LPTRPARRRWAGWRIRAVLAARLWLESAPAYGEGQGWWRSERRIRAALPAGVGNPHIPDADIHWPSIDTSPYAGQVWAIEAELTPKAAGRTARIMTGLLAAPKYAQVVYLTAPAARPVVTRAAANLPDPMRGRVAVRDLGVRGRTAPARAGVLLSGRCRPLCGRCLGPGRQPRTIGTGAGCSHGSTSREQAPGHRAA